MPQIDTAAAAINGITVSMAALGGSILQLFVVVLAMIIASRAGSSGVQKDVRALIVVVGLCAMLLKGYAGIVTGAMALF